MPDRTPHNPPDPSDRTDRADRLADLGFARVDLDRARRCGVPEAIYCPGKTPEQVRAIARALIARTGSVLATRATEEAYRAIAEEAPDAVYAPAARAVFVKRAARPIPPGEIVILCAGTTDLPVAEEARVTAEFLDNRVRLIPDVGVACLHRLLNELPALRAASVVIVVAGMEGALASVAGGLVARPVIAVPTSVGYGANFGGVAALLTMLTSCAPGVAAVNIDDGFGAGCIASLINRTGMADETCDGTAGPSPAPPRGA